MSRHHETLGVPPDADLATIKRAYRQLARQTHPDRGGDPHQFHQICTAYEALVAGTHNAASPDRPEAHQPDEPGWGAPAPLDEPTVPAARHPLLPFTPPASTRVVLVLRSVGMVLTAGVGIWLWYFSHTPVPAIIAAVLLVAGLPGPILAQVRWLLLVSASVGSALLSLATIYAAVAHPEEVPPGSAVGALMLLLGPLLLLAAGMIEHQQRTHTRARLQQRRRAEQWDQVDAALSEHPGTTLWFVLDVEPSHAGWFTTLAGREPDDRRQTHLRAERPPQGWVVVDLRNAAVLAQASDEDRHGWNLEQGLV